jgi:hypothetical protein
LIEAGVVPCLEVRFFLFGSHESLVNKQYEPDDFFVLQEG